MSYISVMHMRFTPVCDSGYNRKICRIYTILLKNDPHQFVYNWVNLQVCYTV